MGRLSSSPAHSRSPHSPSSSSSSSRLGVLALVLSLLGLWYWLSPYSGYYRLSSPAVAFNRPPHSKEPPPRNVESWIAADVDPSRPPPQLYDDMGVVFQTGYAAQHKVASQIAALGLNPQTDDQHNLVVVADFAGRISLEDGGSVEVHDVLDSVLKSSLLGPRALSPRAEKYRALAAAAAADDKDSALRISQEAAWEMDVMKILPSLEYAYREMPSKSWYLLLDSDTFIVPTSLRALLAHLDPELPLYLGSAAGDFRARYARGKSGMVLSAAAMRRLFRQRAVVDRALVEAVTETRGDRLLATTLLQVGVYLDERFSRLFNGFRPQETRVNADRFCLPLVTFRGEGSDEDTAKRSSHKLASFGLSPHSGEDAPDQNHGNDDPISSSSATATHRPHVRSPHQPLPPPLLWGDLWAVYGRPSLDALTQPETWQGRDFVGNTNDTSSSSSSSPSSTTHEGIDSAEACRAFCEDEPADFYEGVHQHPHGGSGRFGLHNFVAGRCLAWTWDPRSQNCTTAPWLVVGEDVQEKQPLPTLSGVHTTFLQHLRSRCRPRTGVRWEETPEHAYTLVYEN